MENLAVPKQQTGLSIEPWARLGALSLVNENSAAIVETLRAF
jgi:hypothetical protein